MLLILESEAATERLARSLALVLRPGDTILLSGPLGAGKSVLARAVIRAACGDPQLDVPSPSYTLVQSYAAGSLTLRHFDLWRLAGPDALAELGWDDEPAAVRIVEWPDRLGHLAPADALRISLSPQAGQRRDAELDGWSDRLRGVAGIS